MRGINKSKVESGEWEGGMPNAEWSEASDE